MCYFDFSYISAIIKQHSYYNRCTIILIINKNSTRYAQKCPYFFENMIERNGKQLTVVSIVIARGGSKGVPRKNIKPLAGKPLVGYTIEAGKGSQYIDRVICSTDDDQIGKVAESFGAEFFKRPAELATDAAAVEPTLVHVVETIRDRENYSTGIMVLLQPTTPFRKSIYIDQALEKLVAHPTAGSIYSVYPAPQKMNPYWISRIDDDGFIKPYLGEQYFPTRQSLPKVYWRDGQIYAVYGDQLLKTGSRYGETGSLPFINEDDKYHINIDDITDFMLAEILIERGMITL